MHGHQDHDTQRHDEHAIDRFHDEGGPPPRECPYAGGAGLELPPVPQHASFRRCHPRTPSHVAAEVAPPRGEVVNGGGPRGR